MTILKEYQPLSDAYRTDGIPLAQGQALERLLQATEDRRYILLGKSTHGTREYIEMFGEFTKRMIEAQPVSFVAIEWDWGDTLYLNAYVKQAPQAPKTAQESLSRMSRFPQWMWANQEFLGFLEGLKIHNAGLPMDKRIGIYGLDLQQTQPHNVLKKQTMRDMLLDTEVTEMLDRNRALYDTDRAWHRREQHMYETLEFLMGWHGENSRAVVWTHNSHAGDVLGVIPKHSKNDEPRVSLGQLLRKAKKNPFLIGTSTYEGIVYAAESWKDKNSGPVTLPPASIASLEHVFHTAEEGDKVIIFSDKHTQDRAVNPKIYTRDIGVIFDHHEPTSYTQVKPVTRFDAIIFRDTTRAISPVNLS